MQEIYKMKLKFIFNKKALETKPLKYLFNNVVEPGDEC